MNVDELARLSDNGDETARNELQRLAENGTSVGAAVYLGDYYSEFSDDYSAIQNALKYYKIAAEKEIPYALFRQLACEYVESTISITLMYDGTIDADTAYAAHQDVLNTANRLWDWKSRGFPGFDSVDMDIVDELRDAALYSMATVKYSRKEYQAAIDLIKHVDLPEAELLRCVCNVVLPGGLKSVEAVDELEHALRSNPEYFDSDKDATDEDIFCIACLSLSISNMVSENKVDIAHELLQKSRPTLKVQSNIKKIDSELSRYSRKLLGGYKYTG